MRLEWIDDILAVLDSGSLALAADRRRLTQSAFTRRVRTIEENIGTTLFDRRRKPVSLMPGVQGLEPELRAMSARLHKLRQSLKTSGDQVGAPLSFVCQHALTATVSPQVVRIATRAGQASVRVRSGNQDECLVQLLSREVDLAIMYALPDDTSPDVSKAFDAINLGADTLIPVCAPAMRAAAASAAIPTIAYPADVFLGHVFARAIGPRLPPGVTTLPVAETALTLAMLQLVISGIGIAWLPYTLVADGLAHGHIVRVDDVLPAQTLDINMLRLDEAQPEHGDTVWRELAGNLRISAP